MRAKIIAALLIIITLLFFGCSPNPKVILIGKILSEKNHYGVTEYTILTSENTTYTFKIRDGYLLPLGQTFEFHLQHIKGDEFISDSTVPVPKRIEGGAR